MTKKSKKVKVSRVTLRVAPEFHARIARVALTLGLDVNGVVNYLLRRGLGQLELEAKAYQRLAGADTDSQFEEMEDWLRQHPGKTRKQFIIHLLDSLMSEPFDPRPSQSLPDLNGPISAPRVTGATSGHAANPECVEEGDDF